MGQKPTQDEKRENLFNLYSTNLSALVPELTNVFVCPLCLESFTREALSIKLLSVEHIIPSGNPTTLTCTACNNKAGSYIDSQLRNLVKNEEDMVISGGPVRAKIKIGEGEQNAEIYLPFKDGEPRMKVVGLPQQSNPTLQEELVKEFLAGTKDLKINFRLGYNYVRSQAALLRSAYLLMFRHFGYAYVLQETTEPLRKQIQEPFTESSILSGVVRLSEPIDQNAVTLLTAPEQLRCFLIMLKLSRKIDYNVGVALPGVNQDCAELYAKWANQSGSDKFGYVHIPYVQEHILNPKYTFRVNDIWNHFNST